MRARSFKLLPRPPADRCNLFKLRSNLCAQVRSGARAIENNNCTAKVHCLCPAAPLCVALLNLISPSRCVDQLSNRIREWESERAEIQSLKTKRHGGKRLMLWSSQYSLKTRGVPHPERYAERQLAFQLAHFDAFIYKSLFFCIWRRGRLPRALLCAANFFHKQ